MATFLKRYKEIIKFVHAHDLTEDYRLGKRRVKKLSDEVSPVARFVRKHAKPADWIHFALDSTHPDCVVCHEDGRKCEIEVTVARAKERRALMEKLNKTGEIRGIINLPDDAAPQRFEEHAEKAADPDQARVYSTEEVADLISGAVEIRARRKANHRADTLLIEVVPDMHSLPDDRWRELRTRLAESQGLKALAFREVYVTGRGDKGDICVKMK